MELINKLMANWKHVGFRFNIGTSKDNIDIEKLIVETSRVGRNEPVLIWGMLAWIVQYGDLINVSRLSRLLKEGDMAVLGAIIEIAISKGADNKLAHIAGKCKGNKQAEILFPIMKESKITEKIEKDDGLDVFKKWGLYCSNISDKSDALNTREFVLKHNPNLAIRALFGSNVKAEILYQLSHISKSYINELARLIGMSYQPVYAEVERMILNKLLLSETVGKLRLVSLNPKILQLLSIAC